MPEVIASILAVSPAELLRRARWAAMAGAGWLEFRLDLLPSGTDPGAILAEVQLPVLVACRTKRDGGKYEGTPSDRHTLLQKWVDAGVQGLDLEEWETWVPENPGTLELMMRSHHNFVGIDDNLPAIRDRLLAMGANIAKIAVTAPDFADAGPVLDLLGSTDQSQTPTIAFAMGESAWPTRVLACVFGAPFVYASCGEGQETAPGQVPVALLTGIYDVRRFTGSTLIYGVLGNPAQHSWGPWLFNRAFRSLDHDGVYLPFTTSHPVATVNILPRRRLRGLSVTAPHKSTLQRLCHEVAPVVEQTGVLNTLTFQAHGSVVGHNTDVAGVREAFNRAGFEVGDGNAVVLGGGGAARAAAVALSQLGLTTTIMPRTLTGIRDFARAQPRAVVNATPVGGPTDPDSRLLPDWNIPAGTFVLDMMYQNDGATTLLRDTAAAGGIPVEGLEMFLTQAREQLLLFTGRRLPTRELSAMVGVR